MAEFVNIRDGGKTNEEGANRLFSKAHNQEAVLGDTDWQVTENSPTPDASIDLALGDGIIQKDDYIFHGWATAKVDITIPANASGNPRIDAVVAYIDLAVVDDTSNNNPGALKFINVQGTPAGSPVAPTDGEIQTAVGASNPFFRLAEIAVADGFSAINNANITDKRTWLALTSAAQTLQYDNINNKWVLTDKLEVDQVNTDVVNEKTTATGVTIDGLLVKDKGLQRFTDGDNDFIGSGGLWSADDIAVDRDASMTAAVAYIGGQRVTVSAVTAKTFTASKDTYVDLGINGVLDYNEVANGASPPALAANHTRLAIVTTGASATATLIDRRNLSPITLARAEIIEGTYDNLFVDNIPARNLIEVLATVVDSGGTIGCDVTFNEDSGANYVRKLQVPGSVDTNAVSQTDLGLMNTAADVKHFKAVITNIATLAKLGNWSSAEETANGAAATMTRNAGAFKWHNTSVQINHVNFSNPGAGSYGAGSKMVIKGYN